MDNPVLIDTSIWINYFRKKEPAYTQLDNLIEKNLVRISRLVIAELLQGAKGTKEIEIILDLPSVFPLVHEFPDTWENAGLLANKMRKRGITIGLADCYLATLAHQNNMIIFSMDSHFHLVKDFLRIKIKKMINGF